MTSDANITINVPRPVDRINRMGPHLRGSRWLHPICHRLHRMRTTCAGQPA